VEKVEYLPIICMLLKRTSIWATWKVDICLYPVCLYVCRILILAGTWGCTWTIQTCLWTQLLNSAGWSAKAKGSQGTFTAWTN